MFADGPGGRKEKEPGAAKEEHLTEERRMADSVHIPVGTAGNLPAGHRIWDSEEIGEAIYIYTLWILRGIWRGGSTWCEINRRSHVETKLEITMGGNGNIGKQYPPPNGGW